MMVSDNNVNKFVCQIALSHQTIFDKYLNLIVYIDYYNGNFDTFFIFM